MTASIALHWKLVLECPSSRHSFRPVFAIWVSRSLSAPK